MKYWPDKDPDAVKDYGLNWTKWLAGDTISTSTWIVPEGLTEGASSNSDTVTKVWLSGGTVDTDYDVTNRITTVGGRTEDSTRRVRVREK